tara:strand:- start:49 stop:204 length:156 start_codon:yes stop_codon:yes gene_type:complete
MAIIATNQGQKHIQFFFDDCLWGIGREAPAGVNKKKGGCHTRPHPDMLKMS